MERVLNVDKKGTTFARLKWSIHIGSSINSTTITPAFCDSTATTNVMFCDDAISSSRFATTSLSNSFLLGTATPLLCNEDQ